MPMHGGPGMAMPWGPMPGENWLGAAASFLGMWTVMMAAMMLPSFAPVLGRQWRAAIRAGLRNPARLTAIVAGAYLLVWAAVGLAVLPLGDVLSRSAPIAAAMVLAAGAIQVSGWKAHHLACLRDATRGRGAPVADAGTAVRHGLRLGLHCCASCLNLTVILLVVGVMDLRAMIAVTAIVTIERLAPAGDRIGRAVGAAIIVGSLLVFARASGVA